MSVYTTHSFSILLWALVSLGSLLSNAAWAHLYHGAGPQTLLDVKKLGDLPSLIQKMENGSFVYSFLIPEKELLKELSMDQNKDSIISNSEFDDTQAMLDKWIRKNITLSSQRNGFLGRVFNLHDDCILGKAQYGPFGFVLWEKLFIVVLEYRCDTEKNLTVSNQLPQLFREEAKVLLEYVRFEKKEGNIELLSLQQGKLVLPLDP